MGGLTQPGSDNVKQLPSCRKASPDEFVAVSCNVWTYFSFDFDCVNIPAGVELQGLGLKTEAFMSSYAVRVLDVVVHSWDSVARRLRITGRAYVDRSLQRSSSFEWLVPLTLPLSGLGVNSKLILQLPIKVGAAENPTRGRDNLDGGNYGKALQVRDEGRRVVRPNDEMIPRPNPPLLFDQRVVQRTNRHVEKRVDVLADPNVQHPNGIPLRYVYVEDERTEVLFV